MEICQFCKKVCAGDRGLSLHMYHNKECFQKLTNITQQFQKCALLHSQMHNSSSNQEYAHQDKKVKLIVIINRIWGIPIFSISMIVIPLSKQTINYHPYLNRFFWINILNLTTESKTQSK